MSGYPSDGEIENPFEDPSVKRAVKVGIAIENEQQSVSSHNFNQVPVPGGYNNMSPAIMQPTQELPPQYMKSGQQTQNVTTDELRRQQEELDRKAAELQRREEELRNSTYNARRNNWPPLPENKLVQPCFYQDINVEIPIEFQKVVRHLYYLWIYHSLIMVVNIFGGLALLIQFQDFTTFGLGVLYFLLFTPFSFLCWFRPAYKAFRSDSSFSFMVFFFVFFFQFIMTVMQMIGLPSSGFCGFIKALSCFPGGGAGNVIVGIFVLLIAINFGFAAAGDLFLLSKIHKIYRSSGASFAKAQQEFTTEFLGNEHVQNAAANATRATIRSQMGANQSSNRY